MRIENKTEKFKCAVCKFHNVVMTAEYIAKGMEFIQTANQKEDEEQFEAAISLYNEGIQQLVTALEYSQKDENMATNLKKQVEQYLKRVEAIKAFVKEAEEQKEGMIHTHSLHHWSAL